MHPSLIILALASAALIHAVAIPQPGAAPATIKYDTCIDHYGKILVDEIKAKTAPIAGIAQCTSCAGIAVAAAYLKYDSDDLTPATTEYRKKMKECRDNTPDSAYNACIADYEDIFGILADSSKIATCTGCAAQAVDYAADEDDLDDAEDEYNDRMNECRANEG